MREVQHTKGLKEMLTPLQEYLKTNGHEKITEELGVGVYEHPDLPLMGFKYCQIDSPKTHEVVRWSRGTVLEKGTWNVVAQPMVRFFNYGENLDEMKTFNWSDFTVTSKEDGSLAIAYFYNGEWHMNTSGSFGLGKYDSWSVDSWRHLFWNTANVNGITVEKMNTDLTYIFELCTMSNKVVRMYPSPKLFLLTTFSGTSELSWDETVNQAKLIGSPLPETFRFNSIGEIESFLSEKEKTDASFEGVVIRDKNNVRFKIKSLSYLALHRINDNGNFGRMDSLVHLALVNEGDEVLTYFPELKDKYHEVKSKVDEAYVDLADVWRNNVNILDQKTYALSVKNNKFCSILFTMKKKGLNDLKNEEELKKLWRESTELIVDRLFPKPKG